MQRWRYAKNGGKALAVVDGYGKELTGVEDYGRPKVVVFDHPRKGAAIRVSAVSGGVWNAALSLVSSSDASGQSQAAGPQGSEEADLGAVPKGKTDEGVGSRPGFLPTIWVG